ncbi:DUF2789 domain-containing protein [Marinobacter sp. X15-166B]|uniref:DUF2789 domain-containing protein n=1 Tax=Marinobacter sp. X15-166B TaxID=1897620 RepID=UPI00085C4148|nr:DUF2789 domain-containing protein [Marinobacter sp. X15-166B]OEY66457.1 hypothetical protein BG841_08295 [Marinobacter sp. X15-166B]
MDTSQHSLSTLFDQLGLDSDPDSIEHFIRTHSPLPQETPLSEAPFWSSSQATFLREGLADDSDWAEVIDELNALLRH